MDKRFLVCGGDLRQITVANIISSYGCDVAAYGFGCNEGFSSTVRCCADIADALSGTDIVILPLPCSLDGTTVNMPMSAAELTITELLKHMNKNQIIVAGMVSEKITNLTHVYNIYISDYFEREELTVLNAIPTVEGALQIAMEELPVTIHASKCLVCGFGRIGKLLAKALQSLGADVTVSARRHSDLAWITAYGYKGVMTDDLKSVLADQAIVFNTVPHLVFDEKLLGCLGDNALLIDLASKPGGVDFNAAAQLGKKVIWALSLPCEERC